MLKEGHKNIVKIGDFGLACIQSHNSIIDNQLMNNIVPSNFSNSGSSSEQKHTKGVGT